MAKCLDLGVKIEGSTCQNVNYKEPLQCLEKIREKLVLFGDTGRRL